IYRIPICGGGDGGMYTTVCDLQLFWDALISARILSPALTETFLTQHVTFDEYSGYGCGFYTANVDSHHYFTLVGGDAGVGFFTRYRPGDKQCVCVLSNTSDGEEAMRAFLCS
ncbi:MAG: hypothetical protein ACOC0D_01160, partial [Spirochaeta sp.]